MWLASGEMVFRGSETIGENVGSASKLARKGKLRNIFIGNASRLLRALGKDSAVITILLCLLAGLHLWQEASTSLLAHEHMRFEGTRGESNDVVALGNEGHAIRGPPSYLPLAQHLKNINQTRKKTSLQDMVYGAQKRTLSDLKPTDNRDLFGCEECTANSKLISRSKIESKKYLNVAQVIMKVITFYNISSMLTLPCAEEIHWVLPLVKTLREVNGNFEHFCAVSSDEVGLDIIKTHTPLELSGSQLVKYGATMGGNLPAVDMMFTWKGLEQYSLDEIHKVFKDVVRCGIKYTLIGNWPGQVNAKMVETDVGTFSIVRPDVAALNVRAYPFGFGGAERVIPMKERQLLFYNATEMRDAW